MSAGGWIICAITVICVIAFVLFLRAAPKTSNSVLVPSDFGEEGEQ